MNLLLALLLTQAPALQIRGRAGHRVEVTDAGAMLVSCVNCSSGGGGPAATVSVSNFPATQPVSGTLTCNVGTGTQPVSGTFWQATQPISGTVTANVGTGTQPVSGTVSVANFPSTQAVTGNFWQVNQPVSVSNFPATQPVSGTVTVTGSVATGAPGTPFRCGLDNLAATLTRCQIATAGQRLFITDMVVQTTTATSGTFSVQSGTGTNCGTGPAALFPTVSTSARWNAPINTQPLSVMQFLTPIIAATAQDICVIGTATNTIRIQLMGYVAP